MKRSLTLLLLTFYAVSASALSFDENKDRVAIRAMTGCYDVTFQSKETFAYSKDYQYYPAYSSGALEWIFVEEETDRKIVLQHLLITPVGIIKHWRQDWELGASEVFSFQGNNTWKRERVSGADVNEQWTQRVFQVDDSPRYECSAPWIHWGEKTYWECEAPTPLPRREFSVRSDYNILKRHNRHEIHAGKWIHDQDNIKINKTASTETKLAMEKTINSYYKTDDQKCESAVTWWNDHSAFWKATRDAWDKLRSRRNDLSLKSSVNGKNLWMTLFELDEEATRDGWSYQRTITTVELTIRQFLN